MDKTLSKAAKDQNIPYHTMWRNFQKGVVENAYKGDDGRIYVRDLNVANASVQTPSVSSVPIVVSTLPHGEAVKLAQAAMDKTLPNGASLEDDNYLPKHRAKASTNVRSNKSAIDIAADRFTNILTGITPFYDRQYHGVSYVSIRDAVEIVMKCYYNFAIFRNVIDLMTELTCQEMLFKGGNKQSRDFFKAFFEKIGMKDFQDQYFREYFRSGNVLIYKYMGNMDVSELKKITNLYATAGISNTVSVPLRYSLVNPMDILVGGRASFLTSFFFKLLNSYEVARLKNPSTEEDKQIFDSLPANIKELITRSNGVQNIILPLDPKSVYYIGYKKQDYEPLAVPMGYPVMEDISRKEEMKKMDLQICRTMQQVVLLVTCGYENKAGDYVVNPNHIAALNAIFANQSIGRVLVADFTTKAQFVIPQIGDILNPDKYKVLERDIAIGLNNVLGTTDEKFANKAISVDIFVQRLIQARNIFLDSFVKPEIKKISETMNFKAYPEPYFLDNDLTDEVQMARIYAQLAQMGVLTPSETILAIETGQLPSEEDSVADQTALKAMKDKGLYQMVSPPVPPDMNGRPPGSGSPQSTKNVSPIGTSHAKFSVKKLVANLNLSDKLKDLVIAELKKKHNIIELTDEQKNVSLAISESIIYNKKPSKWLSSVAKFIENPADKDKSIENEVKNISTEHNIDSFLASIMYHSKFKGKVDGQ